jgi:hypothetical protein
LGIAGGILELDVDVTALESLVVLVFIAGGNSVDVVAMLTVVELVPSEAVDDVELVMREEVVNEELETVIEDESVIDCSD